MNNLIEAVSSYVILFLSENLSNELVFHNINHTYEVVAAAREIGYQCYLSDNEMLALEVAAWFHDCGYANTYLGHENESKKIAEVFWEIMDVKKILLIVFLNCIESTKYPSKPSSLIEKVLCDADLYHLTRTNYTKYEKALRKEFEIFLKLIYTDKEWLKKNCWFLSDHTYYTDFGQEVLSKFKETNIQMHCPK